MARVYHSDVYVLHHKLASGTQSCTFIGQIAYSDRSIGLQTCIGDELELCNYLGVSMNGGDH